MADLQRQGLIEDYEDHIAGLKATMRHDRALYDEVAGVLRRAKDALERVGTYPGIVQAAEEALGGAACSLSPLPTEES